MRNEGDPGLRPGVFVCLAGTGNVPCTGGAPFLSGQKWGKDPPGEVPILPPDPH